MEQKKDDNKYNLYTEHIVPRTGEKIKRGVKRALMTALMAVFFGFTAGLVMLLVYHTGKNKMEYPTREEVKLPNGETDTHTGESSGEDVTVPVPDKPSREPDTDPELVWDEDIKNNLNELNNMYKAVKAVYGKVNSYSVSVKKPSDVVAEGDGGYHSANEAFGIVMAEDSTHYYILTDYIFVSKSTEISITYSNGQTVPGELVSADSTTGFAVIRTAREGLEGVTVAELADSKSVGLGDAVVAVGELYGFVNSVGYGMVTGADITVYDTDTEFDVIITDIVGTATSFGVISNLNGEITGIITSNYNLGTSNHITAYSLDSVTDLIERLMNGKKTPYLGIKGEAVTGTMSNAFGMPQGIYVSAVESNSPAYYAGIQPGDIIAILNNTNVRSMQRFMEVLNGKKEGSTIDLIIKRKGRENYKDIVFTVTLGVE